MSNTENTPEREVSRRQFLEKGAGLITGLAGVFGLISFGGIFDKPQHTGGYSSSSYGAKKA